MTKINYKLLNLVLCSLIIYLIWQTKNFWFGVVSILFEVLLPFFIAFSIAYALNILVSHLCKKIPRSISIIIVLLTVILIIALIIYLVFPLFTEQIISISNGIISFFKEISLKYNISFSTFQEQLSTYFNKIIEKITTIISDGAVDIIGLSINMISKFLIIIAATIYFLKDMEKIKEKMKIYFLNKNKKIYKYLSILNKEMEAYLSGFLKIIMISFFEYTIIYLIIGHPDAILLGFLASIGNLIPYFGGIITNLIAALTAFVISPELFIKTIIVFLIFSSIDGYIINPLVYGKTNKIHPLIIIISVFTGGVTLGIFGIIIALPTAIIIISTYKFIKTEKINIKKIKLTK